MGAAILVRTRSRRSGVSLASIGGWLLLGRFRLPSRRRNLFAFGLATLGCAGLVMVLLPQSFKLKAALCVIGFFPFFILDAWTRARWMKKKIADLDKLAEEARKKGDWETAQSVEDDARRWRENTANGPNRRASPSR